MIKLEALNAMHGDCLLLRYTRDGGEALWIIDAGPGFSTWEGRSLTPWKDVLLPRLEQITTERPIPVDIGMVSHIDDDHINGFEKIMNDLTATSPEHPGKLKFQRFWFNSFERIVGHDTAVAPDADEVKPASLSVTLAGQIDDEDGEAVALSIPQGISLATDLNTLKLQGNPPFGGTISANTGGERFKFKGDVEVVVLGPLQNRLEALRKKWEAALKKTDKAERKAEIASLFLPDSQLDTAIPNLSSIALLVSIRGKTLLLTGDAQGKDLVEAWKGVGMREGPVHINLLKVPHHGSNRNNPEVFLRFFPADHYVFSANGKYDNPAPETVEAVVMVNQGRKFELHFTNRDVTWSEPCKGVNTLPELLEVLREEYAGEWTWTFRQPDELSVTVDLE